MVLAYIGLGGNLDSGAIQPAQTLLQAASELDQLPHTRLMQLSPLYRSAPIGYDDQPDFINAVALLQTRLSAIALLQHLQALELQHGRQRSTLQRNCPRTLDLDLLLYGEHGEQCIDLPALQVPHPRLHPRAFVLRPRTGRTHQLRVALKALGSPVLGDALYADSAEAALEARMYLHAAALRVPPLAPGEPAVEVALCPEIGAHFAAAPFQAWFAARFPPGSGADAWCADSPLLAAPPPAALHWGGQDDFDDEYGR
jgi:2-amino-4-hydroxy-6-hydroxymethyldihydropteridine diphosphokinase